jgi:phosphoribosylaminoimidazole-succinocarboxamide synthase
MQLADVYLRSGKVRDLFQLPNHRILLVASDRISAFDIVLPNVIPDKGRVLTGLSRFWFAETRGIVPNHLLDTDPASIGAGFDVELARAGIVHDLGPLDGLRGRIMICRPAAVLPIEAVVRGYLAGSGWKEYRDRGTVCGIALPPGLRESDRLPEPLFTPATKAPSGEHDENISFDGIIDHLADTTPGGDRRSAAGLAERVREVSLQLYRHAAAVAERKGLILADTKFEFGIAQGGDDSLVLIDEVLTPDSSRFWDAATYAPGGPQASFDKQYVRDWLERQPWDKTAPGPELPDEVVAGTRRRYVEAYERITGASFDRYLAEDVIAPAPVEPGR